MTVSARLYLTHQQSNKSLSFTVVGPPFVVPPRRGEQVVFYGYGWPNHYVFLVAQAVHYVNQSHGALTVLTEPYPVATAIELYTILDQFVGSFLIDTVTENDAEPPYYAFYRTLVKLWGKPRFERGVDDPRALVALVDALLTASNNDDIAADVVASLRGVLTYPDQASLYYMVAAILSRLPFKFIEPVESEVVAMTAIALNGLDLSLHQYPVCLRPNQSDLVDAAS